MKAVSAIALSLASSALLACASAEPASASASETAVTVSEIPAGLWTGTMTQPDGEKLPVTFKITGKASALAIEFSIPQASMTRAFTNIVLSGNKLTFNFAPLVTCELNRQADASFAGVCTENKGDYSKIAMTMVPPKS